MTCNKCQHAHVCHHLIQDERGFDEHTETYYNDMEDRCEDFAPESKYGISNVRVDKLYTEPNKKLKAIVSVTAGYFAVHGIRVFENDTGLFVTMPSLTTKDEEGNTRILELCHALDSASRLELTKRVIEAYEAETAKNNN